MAMSASGLRIHHRYQLSDWAGDVHQGSWTHPRIRLGRVKSKAPKDLAHRSDLAAAWRQLDHSQINSQMH
jgi:hypothetical protein